MLPALLTAAGLFAGLASARAGLAAEPQTVHTPRGAPILVIRQLPEGRGPFPAVVLAPGTGTLRQKINDAVADALQKQGFAVYRFEWAYYVATRRARPPTPIAPPRSRTS